MGIINGVYSQGFTDGDINVNIYLNNDADVASYNAGKQQPVHLEKATRVSDGKFIGNVVVCEEGSVIAISITSSKATCGIEPRIKTQQETLTEGIYWVSTQRNAPNFQAWVKRYNSKKEAFIVNNFMMYEQKEGFKRSNMVISAMDLASVTYDGVNLPSSGLKADGSPGSVDGVPSTAEFGSKTRNTVSGRELGATQLMFFVLNKGEAVTDFYTAVEGVGAGGWD